MNFSDFEVVNLAPVVTGLSVSSGAAGSTVTVVGQNFAGASGHLQVLFGGTPATSATVVDDSHVTAVVPPGVGTVDVRVQSGVTTASNPSNYTNPIFGYGLSGVTTADRFTYSPATVTAGTPVNLGSSFNLAGIVSDGSTFSSTGGLDGGGVALSANLLGTSQTWNGTPFIIGAAGSSDVVSATGQTISLPAGQYASLQFLATAVNGNQANQTFTVKYSDGTTKTFTQSISDWFTPQNYAGESTAVTMPYRDMFDGTKDSRTFDVYGYSFSLDATKTVSSITLPNDANIELLSATLSSATSVPAAPINLAATAGNNQVALSWAASSGATSYNVYRGTASGQEALLHSGVSGTSYTDSTAANGTTYFYEVTAVNSVGKSGKSNEVSATPAVTAGTPVNLGSSFNLAGIVSDGSTFSSTGGLDGGAPPSPPTCWGPASPPAVTPSRSAPPGPTMSSPPPARRSSCRRAITPRSSSWRPPSTATRPTRSSPSRTPTARPRRSRSRSATGSRPRTTPASRRR